MRKRLLSTMLALCVVLTMLPISALATETTEETPETDNLTIESSEAEAPAEESSIPDSNIENATENQTLPAETSEPAPLADDAPTSGTCGENLIWKIENGTLTVSGSGAMDDYLHLDAPWQGDPTKNSHIKNIRIENGVTSIGDNAFQCCHSLTSIDIPNSVTSIGDGAFGNCDCESLTNINIPNSVTSIGDGAFDNCRFLTSINIPNSVTSIGDSAFESCGALTNIDIPDSVTSIGNRVFHRCWSLTSIDIPNSVTSIGEHAFASCPSLTSIDIPDSVTSIGVAAFLDCRNLDRLIIPENVTYLGGGVFSGTNVDKPILNTPNYVMENGLLLDKDKTKVFSYAAKLNTASIPDSVISIEEYAFYGSDLTNITIPEGITSIKHYAFDECKLLDGVKLPSTLTSIGPSAFDDCHSLTNISIPSGVKRLDWDFGNCYNLVYIVIPKSVTSMGYPFSRCNKLADVYYEGNENDWSSISFENYYVPTELRNATIHYNSTGPDNSGDDKPEKPPVTPPSTGGTDTSIGTKRIGFYSPLGQRVFGMDMDWGWNLLLNNPSTAYDYRLAKIALALSGAAERSQGVVESMLKNGGLDYGNKVDGLGFEVVESRNYGHSWDEVFYPAATFGYKRLVADNKEQYIFTIVVRGTDFINETEDIFTNFDYLRAATSVIVQFGEFINTHKLNDYLSTAKFFVTGHSLGGATANIVAKTLNANYGVANVFSYTFAAPRSTNESDAFGNGNIHNILNSEDIVPLYWGNLQRFGNRIWFSRKNYEPAIYTNFKTITNGKDLQFVMTSWDIASMANPAIKFGKFEYGHAVETYMSYLITRNEASYVAPDNIIYLQWLCPVDVEIYVDDGSTDGLLVGRIVNDVIDKSVNPGVYMYANGDKKYAYLPYEGDYTIKMIGNGSGTMEYAAKDIDLTTEKVISEKVYKNVALSDGKQMISKISVWDKNDNTVDTEEKIDTPEVPLYILNSDGNSEKEVLPDGNGTEVYISRTITLDANGGSVSPTTIMTGGDGKISDFPTPVRNGYIFDGWFTESTRGDQVTIDTIFTSGIRLYAHWRLNNTDSKPSDNNPNTPNIPSDNDPDEPNVPSTPSDGNVFITNTNTSSSNSANTVTKQATKSPKTGDRSFSVWLYAMGTSMMFLFIIKHKKKNTCRP